MEKQIAYIRYKMIGLIVIIGLVSAWQWDFIAEGVMAHVYTTGSILSAFAFAIIMAFVFVFKLRNEVIAFHALKEMWDDIRIGPQEHLRDPLWRHYRCSVPGRLFKRPRLLGHAYDLVTDELARTQKIRISVETMNTLVHKISQTIDDEKSLLGYMSGLLVFMGLIGTFIGLLHMVGSMGGIIGTLANSAGGAGSTDAFQQLLGALQEPLKGMASGFAASLFGLFSSLVVGLLARMAGQAAGVLKHEFESWLAGVVQIGEEEYSDKAPNTIKVSGALPDHSMVQMIAGILADYSKLAGSFDQSVRLLHGVHAGQQHQAKLTENIAQSLSRLSAGIENLSAGISKTVATELAATRAMMQDMERSHSTNLSLLSHNHAQTAVQIAAAIESNTALVERNAMQLNADVEARIDGAVRGALGPDGLTVAQQIQKIEAAFMQISDETREQRLDGASGEPIPSHRALEDKITEGFDRLNQTLGAAVSTQSGVLQLVASALAHADRGANQPSEPGLGLTSRKTVAAR